jgi:hypothetical protein
MMFLILPFTTISVSAEGAVKNNKPSETPNYDYEAEEMIGLVSGAEYAISSTAGHFASASGTLSITNYIGQQIQLTHKGNGTTTLDSDFVTINIPGRPAAPSGLQTENESVYQANDGVITGLNASLNYEYKTSGGSFTAVPKAATITGLAPGTYYVRLAATSTDFASAESAALTINAYLQNTDATLSALTIDAALLNESFDAERTAYTATVPYETTEITITATPNDANATAGGNIGTKPFTSNEFSYFVQVSAQDGNTKKTYTITVTRAAATNSLILHSDGNIKYGDYIIPQNTASPILGGGSYSFADSVLTLTNVNFTTSDMFVLSLDLYSSPLTLNINGSNSLASTYNRSYTPYGISVGQSLTITGSGSLTVVSGNSTSGSSYGIGSNDDVIISGTVAVTVTGGTATRNSYGIQAKDITISGTAKVTATGGTAGGNSYGIYSNNGNINFSGGDLTVSGKTSAASGGLITPFIAMVDAANADGRAAVRFDNTPIDLSTVKYIKTYKTEADYLRDYPPTPAPEPEPEPTPTPSYTPSYSPPPPQTYEPGDTVRYRSASGAIATVSVTEDGVIVTAGVNRTGSVNSEATAAAVKKAAEIAYANGYKSITIAIPNGATGISKSTIQKLVKAANGLKLVLALTSMIDGEEVGSIELPINSKTGQILTELYFETESINFAQDYIANKWKTDILGSYETAQKGGWGDIATLTVSMDKLGFSAEEGTELYALIYDTKANKWYQAVAVIEGGNVVIETKRTGVVTIVTQKVK